MKLLTELNRAAVYRRLQLTDRKFVKVTILHRTSYVKSVSCITRFLGVTISRQKVQDRRA